MSSTKIKGILVTGLLMIAVSTVVGCKKKDTEVQKPAPAQKQAAPVREKIAKVAFSAAVPAGLPNVAALPGGIGDVEWINDTPTTGEIKINKKEMVSLIGWAANNNNGSVPSTVILQLNLNNKAYYAPASKTKQKREDVAKNTKVPALADSAWQLDADISSVPSGKYLIGMILSDGTYIVGFDTNKYLVVE